MNWLNTALNIGIAGMQASHASNLRELQNQEVEAQAMAEIIDYLRNQFFRFRKAAEKVLSTEEDNPKNAVVAMRMLELRLDEMGITPEMLPEISDKEYVASTIELIKGNCQRMMSSYSHEEQKKIDRTAEAVSKMPEYKYYFDNSQAMEEYKKHNRMRLSRKDLNSGCLAWIVGLVAISIIIALGVGLASRLSPRGGDGFLVLTFAMIVGGIFLYFKVLVRPGAYREAKKKVESLEEQFDPSRYKEIKASLGGDQETIKENRERDIVIIGDFLDDRNKLYKLLRET